MGFGHEKLDVYRAAIEYVGWAYHYCEALKGHRHAKDQLLRASQAIPLNIAEGNGKATDGDRRRYLRLHGAPRWNVEPSRTFSTCAVHSPQKRARATRPYSTESWRCLPSWGGAGMRFIRSAPSM